MKSLLICLVLAFTLSVHAAIVTSQSVETVTTTSAQVLAAKQSRNYLLVQNNGTEDVYLKFDSAHSGTEGIKIFSGGTYQESGNVPVNAIFMKSATGSQSVTIIEGTN